MEQHRKFMGEAIKLALENVDIANGGPFGAVVVKDGEIIGRGTNRVTSDNDPTAHAEVNAIREACKKLETFSLENCDIYTSCEPCPMCLGSIYWANIGRMYYAATKEDAAKADFSDAHIYQELALPQDKRQIVSNQLMREDAVKVFEKWVVSEKKIPY